MRRLSSYMIDALTVALVAGLVLLLFLWATSYHRFGVFSHEGRMLVLGVERAWPVDTWFREKPPTAQDWIKLLPPSGGSRLAGLEFSRPRTVNSYSFRYIGANSTVTAYVSPRCWHLAIPYWMLAIAAAVPPISRWWVVRRRRARRRHGKCAACGYDLRESPNRCPECGAVPAAAQTI